MNAIEPEVNSETDDIAVYQEAAGKTSHALGKKIFLSIMEDEQHLHDRQQHALGIQHEIFVYARRTLS